MNVAILALSSAVSLLFSPISFAQSDGGQSTTAAIVELQKRVETLERRVNTFANRISYPFAVLDCNTGKFDEMSLTTNNLVFLAACTKIEPYLEGHRITISLGNPHSFHFREVRGLLNYGKDLADAVTKSVEVSPPDGLRAGMLNTFVVTVNPSRPEELRVLRLELGSNVVAPTR